LVGPSNGKIVLQRQTAHVASLPLPGLRRTAEPVASLPHGLVYAER